MLRENSDVKMKMETVKTKDNPEDGRVKDDPERQSRGGGYSGGQRRDRRGNEEEERQAVDICAGIILIYRYKRCKKRQTGDEDASCERRAVPSVSFYGAWKAARAEEQV